ncbi:replicative dna helicase [hydrocarbon metagenome]|uniref:Replicative dna helicase n=1 Tax=hydrocarbon metagenome TaxID=938273 RepID=A0A0W8G111_9ZZZZ
MISEKFVYAEFVLNGLHNRNQIENINTFKIPEPRFECYRSMFLFDKIFKNYVQKTGSTKNYLGEHISDALIFDFDGADLEAVKKEAVNFIWSLYYNCGVSTDYPRIAFSGSKGFHVTLPIEVITAHPQPSPDFSQTYKSLCLKLSDGFQNDKGIYNINRIFRMLNSVHHKTGLYKIPLTFAELQKLSIEEIKKLAKNPRQVETLPITEIEEVDTLKELWNESLTTSTFAGTANKKSDAEDIQLFIPAREGERNQTAIRLTGILIKRGLDEKLTTEIMKVWNGSNTPPLPDRELETLVSGAFKRYKEEADKKNFEIFDIATGLNEYSIFAQQPESNKIRFGFHRLDDALRGINRGETLCLIGKTAVGKSAFLQNIGFNYAKESGQPVLFFSMEMPITSVIERSLQMEHQITGFDVERTFKKNPGESKRLGDKLIDSLSNFFTITESGMDLQRIKAYIQHSEQNIYKHKTGLVMIDYLGLVKSKGKDLYEQVSRVAREIKDLAKELDVPILFLSQTTKQNNDYSELTIGSARDSGAVDEASDFVLGLWKDSNFEQINEDKESSEIHLQVGLLKNRRGRNGKFQITMDKKSLQFSEPPFFPDKVQQPAKASESNFLEDQDENFPI